MNIAIILAGGLGTRMMKKIPKQFIYIQNKPLIVHTLLRFTECELIDKVAIVCLPSYKEHMIELIKEYNVPKVEWIIDGGDNRHHSIQNSANFLKQNGIQNDDIVIIHNANMPMVTNENITNCVLKCLNGYDVVTTAAKCNGYFYEIYDGKLRIGPDRNVMFGAKTPEALKFNVFDALYNDSKFDKKEYESYTAGMLGILNCNSIDLVLCDSTNIKVTTEDDYKLISTYLSNQK